MVAKTFETAFEQVTELATRFADNESAYLSPRYQEAEVRQDFSRQVFRRSWLGRLSSGLYDIIFEERKIIEQV